MAGPEGGALSTMGVTGLEGGALSTMGVAGLEGGALSTMGVTGLEGRALSTMGVTGLEGGVLNQMGVVVSLHVILDRSQNNTPLSLHGQGNCNQGPYYNQHSPVCRYLRGSQQRDYI